MTTCASALRLQGGGVATTTGRRFLLQSGGASLLVSSVVFPAGALEDAPIDMDKIRALASKRQNMDMSVPKDRDPRDVSLKDVVMGSNGAVIRLDNAEIKEMERIGFLVKDSFRGRAPDFYSLRDFQPRGWYSAPLKSTETAMGRFMQNTEGIDLEQVMIDRAAKLRASVAAKAAAVSDEKPPPNWEAPIKDDGTYCGVGKYQTLCADPSPGQKFIAEALEGKNSAPPEKLKFTPVVETLSNKLFKK